MKKKVTIVSIYGDKNGGVEHVTYYLKKLLSKDYDVRIISARHSFGKMDMVIYPLFFSLALCFLHSDIVIVQCWHAFLYKADFIIAHGTMGGYMEQTPEMVSSGARLAAFMEKAAAKRAKNVLAVSRHCKDELINIYHIKAGKIRILNNFVKSDYFYPLKDKETDICRLRILFVGRLCYGKGIDRILHLAEYIENLNDVSLLVVSNDWDNTEQFMKMHNTKVRAGLSMSEMNQIYNCSDVFYFPTRYEGFSMASLEALSSGLPVIGSEYAIPDEFAKYQFVYRIEDYSPNNIVQISWNMKKAFQGKKNEIHETISYDFGEESYRKKLQRLIRC